MQFANNTGPIRLQNQWILLYMSNNRICSDQTARICACWSGLSLFAYDTRAFSHEVHQLCFLGGKIKMFTGILALSKVMKQYGSLSEDCWTSSNFKLCKQFYHGIKMFHNVRIYTFGHILAAEIQISLRIRTVWSEPLLGVFWIAITKKRLYNFDPLKPHFYIVKLGFTWVYVIFLILLKNIDCGYSLEPPRGGGSNEYPQSMFWAGMWKCQNF